jgi:hypothetical protein
VADCPEHPDGAAKVVDDEVGVVNVERVEEAFEDAFVEGEVVLGVEGFVREAVAREVDGDGAVGFGELRHDVAPQVGGGWEAVEEEDWGAGAGFRVVEAEVVDGEVVTGRLGHRGRG